MDQTTGKGQLGGVAGNYRVLGGLAGPSLPQGKGWLSTFWEATYAPAGGRRAHVGDASPRWQRSRRVA